MPLPIINIHNFLINPSNGEIGNIIIYGGKYGKGSELHGNPTNPLNRCLYASSRG